MSEAALPAGWPAMSVAQAHAMLTSPGMPFEMETVNIRGVEVRAWKNQPPTLRAVFEACRQHGEKIFLVYEDERVSFEAFHRAVAAFANDLQAQGVT
ncbi:MAG TPA: long-chain fatty acid--CoA ligase, partial [Phenylobacterium sp.]|nr:long-chain fatty acid--CoA ligase [Phenylobacterium sp.]